MAEQYLTFTEDPAVSPTSKTTIVQVSSTRHGDTLGTIVWYGRWRQYVFAPTTADMTVYNPTCLRVIADYIAGMMAARRERQRG